MSFENWQKLNELFAAASGLSSAERSAFVASVEDAEIRRELETLLASHESANKFLNKNAVEISAKTLVESETDKLIGTEIGNFKIIGEIGRGGMGAVYLAERTGTDFTQKVALKLIKRGMDTDFIVQRFRNERRILSRLNHPFIAKLFDGGTTADNLPYFVMEFVEGENLIDFCRNHELLSDKKLKLFRQICEAVEYAHRNLIVHRDLKPSNIIVTADGTPKLLDFGIAKLLDSDDAATEKTTTEFRLLTPKYASPEQVRGELAGTQSDVFSLGVLLDEMFSTAQNPQIPNELKTIIGKSKQDEISRRYASVEQFSEDIRRYQNGLPIFAQADSFGYRTQKFIGRHRFGVLAASLILLTLFGGIAATFIQFRQTQIERKLAEKRFDDVRSLANSVIFDLHDEIQNLPGSTKARKLLVEKALEYLNKLEQDAGNDAGLQHELAMAYSKIGDVQGQFFEASLLETGNAAVNYRKALELAEKSVANAPDNYEFRRDLALICHRFAQFQRGGSDLTETLVLENRSAEIFEKLAIEKPLDAEVRRLWLISRRGYSDVLREAGELKKSLPLYEQNLNLMLAALRDFPDDVKLRRFSAGVYGNFAVALFLNDEKQKAFENQMIAKDIAEKMNEILKDDISAVRGIGASCEDATKYASAIGNNSVAESSALQGIRIMEKIAKEDTENLEAKYDVASLHNTYADFLEKNNRLPEAFEHRQKVLESIALLEKAGDNPDYFVAEFFSFYSKSAGTAAKLGKKDLAAKYIQNAESLNFQIEKATAEVKNLYPINFVVLGDAETILGNQEKAANYYMKAFETWQNLQTNGKLYPNQSGNFASVQKKIKP